MKNEIDTYISSFSKETQELLKQIRTTIRKEAPDAEEAIKYAIPTFILNGNLVHFAAFKNHIGFYPIPSGIEAFKDELSIYKQGKGSVQFPLDKPLPLDLISRIVKYRVQENSKKIKKSKDNFLSSLSSPARRALENNGIHTLEKLSNFSEKEILAFHGMGKASLPKLRSALKENSLTFKS